MADPDRVTISIRTLDGLEAVRFNTRPAAPPAPHVKQALMAAMDDDTPTSPGTDRAKRLSHAQAQARMEADLRRKAREQPPRPPEQGGRGGEEPTRYGDWEVKGLASDF